MSTTLKILADEDDLAAHAAVFIIDTLAEAIAARGRAVLALSGGSTPQKTYALLSQPALRERIDWSRTYFFFGDERFVPADDAGSNFGMAQRLVLDPLSVPHANIFPVPTQLASADAAARVYADTIGEMFGLHQAVQPPSLDLVLLGLGQDGHVAGLFPGAASLRVGDRWVVAGPPGALPPHVDRITMTFPMINAAHTVLFLVSGASKAAILHDALEGGRRREECPAVGVRPVHGALRVYIDRAAAGRLS